MIALLKVWIFLMILLQNHYFIKYIDSSRRKIDSLKNNELSAVIGQSLRV
jgi:hypothetical protein